MRKPEPPKCAPTDDVVPTQRPRVVRESRALPYLPAAAERPHDRRSSRARRRERHVRATRHQGGCSYRRKGAACLRDAVAGGGGAGPPPKKGAPPPPPGAPAG